MHANTQMERQKALANASSQEEQFASCQAPLAPRRKFADALTNTLGLSSWSWHLSVLVQSKQCSHIVFRDLQGNLKLRHVQVYHTLTKCVE